LWRELEQSIQVGELYRRIREWNVTNRERPTMRTERKIPRNQTSFAIETRN
jgi:hypothetical protein